MGGSIFLGICGEEALLLLAAGEAGGDEEGAEADGDDPREVGHGLAWRKAPRAPSIEPELDNTPFLIAMGVLGVGMGLVVSQLGNIVQSAIGDEQRSEAGGLQNTAHVLLVDAAAAGRAPKRLRG